MIFIILPTIVNSYIATVHNYVTGGSIGEKFTLKKFNDEKIFDVKIKQHAFI